MKLFFFCIEEYIDIHMDLLEELIELFAGVLKKDNKKEFFMYTKKISKNTLPKIRNMIYQIIKTDTLS